MESEWNKQLKEWYQGTGKPLGVVADEIGIPRATLGDYISGRISNLNKLADERRRLLYEKTGLEIFKPQVQTIEIGTPQTYNPTEIKERVRAVQVEAREKIEEIVSQVPVQERQKQGLLRAQLCGDCLEGKIKSVMELFEVLSLELDYFRTATPEERARLAEKVKASPEDYAYAMQIMNVLVQGKGVEDWMLMIEPPAKLRKIRRR